MIETRLQELDSKPENSEDDIEEIKSLKRELGEIEIGKARGALIRSKVRWLAEGEKPTKYFLGLEKKIGQGKVIRQLYDGDVLVEGTRRVLEVEKDFYEKLYSSGDATRDVGDGAFSVSEENQLTREENGWVSRAISKEELEKELNKMKSNKSPGSDGLTVNFYKKFWSIVQELFYEMVKCVHSEQKMTAEQKRGIITVIPKKGGDKRFITNWRPITLLNVDYKVISKVIAARIAACINKLVNEDQHGFIKGRYIGIATRRIEDCIRYLEGSGEKGLIVSLDFQKAYDSVSWNFIYNTLQAFNMGEELIQWTKILLQESEACVTNNGFSSEWFNIEKGVKQGDPISSNLFTLVVERLATALREDERVEGIFIGQAETKVIQFADDMTILVKNEESMARAFKIIGEFGQISGLKLNEKKTQGFNVGQMILDNPLIQNLKWVNTMEVLGINFVYPYNKDRSIQMNFGKAIQKMKSVTKAWSKRDITLKGRIVIVNTLVLPIIAYVMAAMVCPPEIVKNVKRIIDDCIWRGKTCKIGRKFLYQKTADGGLGLHDIETILFSNRIKWISRILNDRTKKWVQYLEVISGQNAEDFLSERTRSYEIKDAFYKELQKIWAKVYTSKEPGTKNMVLCEKIWNNRFIEIKGETIEWKSWRRKGVRTIEDVVENGKIMNAQELNEKYNIQATFLKALQLREAIPSGWRKLIKTEDKIIQGDKFIVSVGQKEINLMNVRSKVIYDARLEQMQPKVSRYVKWEELIPEADNLLTNENWNAWFTMPYECTRDVRLQTLQYKINNRLIVCNTYLRNIKVKETARCNYCPRDDTIVHFFIECPKVQEFWVQLSNWLDRNGGAGKMNIQKLDKAQMLFGILAKSEAVKRLNFIMIAARAYIYRVRLFYENKLDTYEFLMELKNRLNVRKLQAVRYNTCEKDFRLWRIFFNSM